MTTEWWGAYPDDAVVVLATEKSDEAYQFDIAQGGVSAPTFNEPS